jgi:hypothetical protein
LAVRERPSFRGYAHNRSRTSDVNAHLYPHAYAHPDAVTDAHADQVTDRASE